METATKKKLVPLLDRVIVRRAETQSQTEGGIIIPDAAKEKMQEGVVVSVGVGVQGSIADGDNVLFGKYAGMEIEVESESFLIMREEEVIALVVEGE